ncbi:MAG TPA: helix-turn-helix domain-containing protein [Bryobacteraceae bacterium]|nr:helix-turn-helix domain-containing protein [Bryobacteraceae bacterium]
MTFQELRCRFVDHLRERVRSGELTERSLAKMTGVSQPHIHNVLKGKRVLSPEMSDEILLNLQMDLMDLVTLEDLICKQQRR